MMPPTEFTPVQIDAICEFVEKHLRLRSSGLSLKADSTKGSGRDAIRVAANECEAIAGLIPDLIWAGVRLTIDNAKHQAAKERGSDD